MEERPRSLDQEGAGGTEGSKDEDFLSYHLFYERFRARPPNSQLLGTKIARFLENLIEANSQVQSLPSVFDLKTVPKISVNDYIARIVQYSSISAEGLILGIVLIEKYLEANMGVYPTAFNIHK